MAIGPIDYSSLLTQLDVTPLQNGLQLRNQRQGVQQAREAERQRVQLAEAKFTAEQAQDVAYQDALKGYLANPTPEALLSISAQFPEHQKALSEGAAMYTDGQRNSLVTAGFATLGALSAGKNDLAIRTLQERRDGLAKAGINTDQTDAAIDLIRQGKIKEAQGYISYAMTGLVGVDHVGSTLTALGVGANAEDKRADNERADRALDIRERQAEAAIARGEAASARAERAADRADRKAAGGSGGDDGYEYRVGPGGIIQRRKKR